MELKLCERWLANIPHRLAVIRVSSLQDDTRSGSRDKTLFTALMIRLHSCARETNMISQSSA